jgi:hypothetical protein
LPHHGCAVNVAYRERLIGSDQCHGHPELLPRQALTLRQYRLRLEDGVRQRIALAHLRERQGAPFFRPRIPKQPHGVARAPVFEACRVTATFLVIGETTVTGVVGIQISSVNTHRLEQQNAYARETFRGMGEDFSQGRPNCTWQGCARSRVGTVDSPILCSFLCLGIQKTNEQRGRGDDRKVGEPELHPPRHHHVFAAESQAQSRFNENASGSRITFPRHASLRHFEAVHHAKRESLAALGDTPGLPVLALLQGEGSQRTTGKQIGTAQPVSSRAGCILRRQRDDTLTG